MAYPSRVRPKAALCCGISCADSYYDGTVGLGWDLDNNGSLRDHREQRDLQRRDPRRPSSRRPSAPAPSTRLTRRGSAKARRFLSP